MHKYHVEIVVVPYNQTRTSTCEELPFPLLETTFIAVSAYQNLDLTKLKIDNNPFAKGFRDKMQANKARQEQCRHNHFSMLPSGKQHFECQWIYFNRMWMCFVGYNLVSPSTTAPSTALASTYSQNTGFPSMLTPRFPQLYPPIVPTSFPLPLPGMWPLMGSQSPVAPSIPSTPSTPGEQDGCVSQSDSTTDH